MPQPPPEHIERVDSGSGTVSVSSDGLMSREVEVKWLVHSVTGYTDAEEKGRQLAPLIYDGHRRASLQCRPVGGGWYEITASYGNGAINSYEGFSYTNDDGVVVVAQALSVDTTGGTEHITQAWSDSNDPEAYVGRYPEATAPTSHGAINVSGNQVNGVDVTVPSFNFTETWLIPAWYLFAGVRQAPAIGPNVPYAKELRELTGKVNSDAWRIFRPGEVLFLGARFDANASQTMVPVTFSFSARLNRDSFFVGDIEIATKSGWDYLWVYYEDAVEDFFAVKKPRFAYVDRVYERAKFSGLKIGSQWSQMFMLSGDVFSHPMVAARKGQT